MLKASFKKHELIFKIPGGTSRGILKTKPTWFLKIWEEKKPEVFGIGECSIIPKLSIDDRSDYEEQLKVVCQNIESYSENYKLSLNEFPSIQFAVETALLDLKGGGNKILYKSNFTSGLDGIKINGLVWMGDSNFMQSQIKNKLKEGYNCIKMKIGAIDFDTEYKILSQLRETAPKEKLILRVDANGAFSKSEAEKVLKMLSELNIHSIEQPIKQKQWLAMGDLCSSTPTPIALDEELIGVFEEKEMIKILETIKPQYLIFKPSLLGGFHIVDKWISLCKKYNIGWWITSALESNIGLNAIAQYTYSLNTEMHQGLGTGKLFTNNIKSPLKISRGNLYFDPEVDWDNITF